jgi:hypothetical protein
MKHRPFSPTRHPTHVALCAAAWALSGCYLFSDFDDLGGGGAAGSSSSSSSASTAASGGAGGAAGGAGGSAAPASSGSGGATGATGGSGGGGGAGCVPGDVDYSPLVMNELAPKGVPDDWIEIRNTGAVAIPLCGVMVTQDYDDLVVPDGPDRFTFYGDAYLGPGKLVVIAELTEFPFGLSKDGSERITMFAPDGTVLDDTSWLVDSSTEFTSAETWARIPDGSGPFKRSNNPTKGTSNYEIANGGAGGGG